MFRPLRSIFGLLAAAFHDWKRDRADRLGAALAYYTVLSIPPLLIFLIGVAGLVFGQQSVEGRVLSTLERLFGAQGTEALRSMLDSMRASGKSAMATGFGLVTLLLGASGVFGHLKDSLDTIWNVKPESKGGWKAFIKKYVFSLTVLMGTGFLLVVSLAVSALLGALGDYLGRSLPGGAALWSIVNFAVSLIVVATLFALMFRYIPAAKVTWRQAWIGGAITSVLFTIGEAAIGYYLGRSNVGSAFGVAGSLVVLLVWVYYSALIFFYGAELTQVYGQRHEEGVEPRVIPMVRRRES